MTVLHDAAATGFEQGATTYAQGRPGYADEAVAWLRGSIGLGAELTVLELGAGTGKFTRRLTETGARVLAAEPVAAMRRELERVCPGAETLDARAEAIPLADASIDAVVCAQAFHWFANERALGEIRRVLRPGGVFGLIWNVRDESVPWVATLTDIMRPYEGDAPRYHKDVWRTLFPAAGFSALEARHFRNDHVGAPERVIVDRVLSTSFIAALSETEQAHVAAEVRALIAATPELAGRDTVTYPYETAAYHCRRTS